jgi:DNA-binding IclR family transcriptional regulator
MSRPPAPARPRASARPGASARPAAAARPDAPGYGPAPQYPIDSVDKALLVLLLLRDHDELRLTEVSAYLGVASSTAHRLLAMLQYRGLIRQDPATRAYHTGPVLDELAFGVMQRLDVRAAARPVLEHLSKQVLETVHLGLLEGTEVRFIDAIESPRALRVGSRLGRMLPAHCTSTGKALLALLPDAEIRSRYPDEQLPQLTPRTISTRTELLSAVSSVRRIGYAMSREENEDGVSSLAVAVAADHPSAVAINVSVPQSRMSVARRAEMLAALRRSAVSLAARLPSGYVPLARPDR